MRIAQTVREFLREPVEPRLRIMMYAMTGLLVYFILDHGLSGYTAALADWKSSMQQPLTEIETNSALIEQIPALLEKSRALREEKIQIEMEQKEWLDQIVRCNEKMLVDVCTIRDSEQTPFYQIQVSEGNPVGPFSRLIYTIDLNGSYPDIVKVLQRMDDSPCHWNISEWSLHVNASQDDRISGVLSLDIYKPSETKP